MSTVTELNTPLANAVKNYEFLCVIYGEDLVQEAMTLANAHFETDPESNLAYVGRDSISLYRRDELTGEMVESFHVKLPGLTTTVTQRRPSLVAIQGGASE